MDNTQVTGASRSAAEPRTLVAPAAEVTGYALSHEQAVQLYLGMHVLGALSPVVGVAVIIGDALASGPVVARYV